MKASGLSQKTLQSTKIYPFNTDTHTQCVFACILAFHPNWRWGGRCKLGAVLFYEVGRIFRRGAVFSSQMSPPGRFHFTKAATFAGQRSYFMTPAMTLRTMVEDMRSSRRHIQSVIDRETKTVARQHNRNRDRLSSRGVAKLQSPLLKRTLQCKWYSVSSAIKSWSLQACNDVSAPVINDTMLSQQVCLQFWRQILIQADLLPFCLKFRGHGNRGVIRG